MKAKKVINLFFLIILSLFVISACADIETIGNGSSNIGTGNNDNITNTDNTTNTDNNNDNNSDSNNQEQVSTNGKF